MLSDRDILAALADGRLRIEPLCRANIQPASIDLRLGWEFQEPGKDKIVPTARHFMVWPRQFILATTVETVSLGAPSQPKCPARARSVVRACKSRTQATSILGSLVRSPWS